MPSLEELLLAGEHGSPALGALGHLFQQLPAGAGFFGGQEYSQGQQDRSVIRDQLEKQRARQAQFEAERAALGPGAPPEAMSGLALKYAGPQDLLKYADDYQKLAEAKKLREAQQAGLTAIMGGDATQASPSAPAGPQQLGVNFPAGGAPDTPSSSPTISTNSPEYIAKRVKQLDALSLLYANNPPAVTAIARERDKLLATKEIVPSVHIVQDKTSPTGWSYGDAKQEGKILMKGAPPPANQEVTSTPDATKSAAAQVAAGMPLAQVVPGYGRNIGVLREKVRQEAIKQISAETGKSQTDAGTELANRTIDYAAGRRSVTQLTTMLGATRQAVAQLDFNVNKVTEAMDKLGGGGAKDLSPLITAMARGAEKWTGDPAYSELYFYMHAAAMESARILQGGQASIAQLHQGAAEEAKKWASANMTTPKAWKEGVAPAMRAEGHARLKTYNDAIAAARLGQRSEVPLTPETPTPAAQGGWRVTPVP